MPTDHRLSYGPRSTDDQGHQAATQRADVRLEDIGLGAFGGRSVAGSDGQARDWRGVDPPRLTALSEVLARARALAARGERVLLGITGAPGAGKSTLAQMLVDATRDSTRLVSMDG